MLTSSWALACGCLLPSSKWYNFNKLEKLFHLMQPFQKEAFPVQLLLSEYHWHFQSQPATVIFIPKWEIFIHTCLLLPCFEHLAALTSTVAQSIEHLQNLEFFIPHLALVLSRMDLKYGRLQKSLHQLREKRNSKSQKEVRSSMNSTVLLNLWCQLIFKLYHHFNSETMLPN